MGKRKSMSYNRQSYSTPCVGVKLSKSSFIYQLLINQSSKAFDSDQIRSFELTYTGKNRKSDRKSHINGGDVSLK